MIVKKTILFVVAALLTACSSYHAELSPAPGKCYVEMNNSLFIETHLRSIDDGVSLLKVGLGGREKWTGDKTWINPGVHTLVVVCEAEYPWNKLVEDVVMDIEFKKGYRYELQAHFDAKTALVEVKEIPHLTHGFFWTR